MSMTHTCPTSLTPLLVAFCIAWSVCALFVLCLCFVCALSALCLCFAFALSVFCLCSVSVLFVFVSASSVLCRVLSLVDLLFHVRPNSISTAMASMRISCRSKTRQTQNTTRNEERERAERQEIAASNEKKKKDEIDQSNAFSGPAPNPFLQRRKYSAPCCHVTWKKLTHMYRLSAAHSRVA